MEVNQINSPQNAGENGKMFRSNIISKLKSGKFVFVAVVYTIYVLLALLEKLGLGSKMSLIGTIKSLLTNKFFGSFFDFEDIFDEFSEITSKISTVFTVISVIKLLFLVMFVVSLWLFYSGAKNPEKSKQIATGSAISSVYIALKTIKICILPIAGIIALFFIMGNSASSNLRGFLFLMILIAAAVILFVALFTTKLNGMLEGMLYSINLNENHLHVSGYVIFVLWLMGIIGIITGLKGGILAIAENVCIALCNIFIASLFSSYKKECGQADAQQLKDIKRTPGKYKQLLNEKILKGESIVWGFNLIDPKLIEDLKKRNENNQNVPQSAENIQPFNNVQPIADAQPVTYVQPAANPQPVTYDQPVSNVQMAENAQQTTYVQPIADTQPVANVQPNIKTQPVTYAQPASNIQPATNVQPTANVQPVAYSQQTANINQTTSTEYVANIPPVTPIVQQQPVFVSVPAANQTTQNIGATEEKLAGIAKKRAIWIALILGIIGFLRLAFNIYEIKYACHLYNYYLYESSFSFALLQTILTTVCDFFVMIIGLLSYFYFRIPDQVLSEEAEKKEKSARKIAFILGGIGLGLILLSNVLLGVILL